MKLSVQRLKISHLSHKILLVVEWLEKETLSKVPHSLFRRLRLDIESCRLPVLVYIGVTLVSEVAVSIIQTL